MKNRNAVISVEKVAGMFVLGALAGAGAALLLAPRRGAETREYLGRKVNQGRTRAASVLRRSREVGSRQKRRLAQAASAGREHLLQAGTHLADAARNGRDAIRDVAEDVGEHVRRAAR